MKGYLVATARGSVFVDPLKGLLVRLPRERLASPAMGDSAAKEDILTPLN